MLGLQVMTAGTRAVYGEVASLVHSAVMSSNSSWKNGVVSFDVPPALGPNNASFVTVLPESTLHTREG